MKITLTFFFFVFCFSLNAQLLDGVRQDDVVLNMQERKKMETMEKELLLKQLEAKKGLQKSKAKIRKEAIIAERQSENVSN